MINIAEILKDCPKGTKLYSPLCGECRLIKIYDSLGFDVINGTNDVFNFSYDGRYNLMGECCIFPSKENRDWSKFQRPFKDGDIISNSMYIAIFHKVGKPYTHFEKDVLYYHCYYNLKYNIFKAEIDFGIGTVEEYKLATEEETQKLFDAIKANGYKWNEETKTLEKLILPKFKIGDVIENGKTSIKIGYIDDEYYYEIGRNIANRLYIKNQDEWELVKDNIKTKFKVGDRIKQIGSPRIFIIKSIEFDRYILHNNQHIKFKDEKIYESIPDKFDISTLKPFDKVLVRHSDKGIWTPQFFAKCNPDDKPFKFVCIGWATLNEYTQCIPYENNEHLLETTDDCDEYYKNW